MIPQITYFMGFIFGFVLTFIVLRALNIEKYFNKGRVFEIQAAYVLLSLIGGHLIGHMAHFIVSLF
jgi:uncharacterized membrane protein YwzB